MADRAPLISVVIPVKDEQATVPGLAAEIAAAFADAPFAWEAVWIDDGSTDRDPRPAARAALPRTGGCDSIATTGSPPR